jgi:hypothetical protein
MTMNHLTADQALLERLSGIVEPVEIRDASGKVMGTYTPVLSPEEQEAYRQAAELFDPAELDRIEQTEQRWHTIEDIRRRFDDLEKRA